MIEQRPLTKVEFDALMLDAPPEMTRRLVEVSKGAAWEFLQTHVFQQDGGLENGRPIYYASLVKSSDGYYFCTVVSHKVHEQIAFFRKTRQALRDWEKKFQPLYAMMSTTQAKNIEWIKRMGFKEVENVNGTVKLEYSYV